MFRRPCLTVLPRLCAGLALGLGLAGPAAADEGRFVTTHLLATLYHELGHAVIDAMAPGLPLKVEEAAADAFAVVLVERMMDEAEAQDFLRQTSFGYLSGDDIRAENGAELAYWAEHGATLERFHDMACLFYGGNPAERGGLADWAGLPADRRPACVADNTAARVLWMPVWAALAEGPLSGAPPSGPALRVTGADPGDEIEGAMRHEAAALSAELRLAEPIAIGFADCGAEGRREGMVFDPDAARITICREYLAHLEVLAAQGAGERLSAAAPSRLAGHRD